MLTRAPVRWGAPPEQSASGAAAAVPRKCCVFQTLIKAEWHAHLASVSRAAARGMVEKEVARSWIVNFVENTGRRGELLRLMASWWDFSEGDLLRCGLLDEPPPPVDVGPDAGITEQFAAFLDREGHSGDSPSHSPSNSRPASRRGSFS